MPEKGPIINAVAELHPSRISGRLLDLSVGAAKGVRGAALAVLKSPITVPRLVGRAAYRAPGIVAGSAIDTAKVPFEMGARAIRATRDRVSSLFGPSLMPAMV